MKRIPLTQGKFALVDDEDFGWLNQWKWHAVYRPKVGDYIAERTTSRKSGKHNLFMHREIMSALPKVGIDHVNHNGLDNRRKNLRVCNQSQNAANTRQKKRALKTSRFKGVSWHKGANKWRATITENYKQIHLGFYRDEIEAAKIYDKTAKRLFGEFAYLNF